MIHEMIFMHGSGHDRSKRSRADHNDPASPCVGGSLDRVQRLVRNKVRLGQPIHETFVGRDPVDRRIDWSCVSQNGNAYEEGLSEGRNPIRAYWQDPSPDKRKALRAFLIRRRRAGNMPTA